jgi:cytoskeletal protein RodZ
MKRKLLIVLSAIILISLAFGCTAQKDETQKAVSTTATSISVSQNSETTSEISTKAQTSSERATEKTTAKAESTTKSKKPKTTVKATTKAKKKKTTKAEIKNVCYITIECKSILDNPGNLKEGHESFVPSDGIILERTECPVSADTTAYDILEYACDKNGIKLTSRDTIYDIYVSGINNLDEFDCGAQSGWVYTVNSVSPTKSCGKYTVSNGDEIVFKYVC